jgi:hypothetical protein
LLLCAAALASFAVPGAAQWSSDKPPVLTPDDYPPVADDEDAPGKDAPPATDKNQAQPPADSDSDDSAQQRPPAASDVQTGTLPATQNNGTPPRAPVEVGSLGAPEGPPAGTLEPPTGSLGDQIWSGSERGKVEELLDRAPLASADPHLRDLTRRLVLTRAPAPPGTAPHAFATVRIRKLLDAGLIDEAGTLAAMAQVPNDEEFAQVQAEALLTANRSADVCSGMTSARMSAGDVFWMQLRAFCAQLGGDTATAELTRDVLRAQGNQDPAYDTLVQDVLTHKAVPPGAIAHPTAMHLYLLQQAGLPVTEALARTMGTPANVLVLRDARNSPRARFEAAERVVSTGAASIADLKAIADAQDLPMSKVASAATDAPNLPFFMGQVLLRRAATIEPRPDEKARLAALALSLADKQNMLPLGSALQADVIATVKPSPATAGYSRDFARALLLADRPDAAAHWAGGDPVMHSIAGLMSRDSARNAAAQNDLSTFAASFTAATPSTDPERSYKALVLGMADVLGLPMPPDAKGEAGALESQMWDGKRPGPGTMRTIEELSARSDRRGETLLMMLGAIHSVGLRDLAPDVSVTFVRLLVAMNEKQAAWALAFDAMAQYVPPPLPAPTASAQ